MKNEDEVEGGIEVEAPRTFFPDEVEEEVEGGRRDDTYVENVNDNDGVPQQQKTWYSRTIGKVAILFLAVFAVCVAIGYGSGYGINEKIHSNKAASVSSAKNGAAYETYDTPPKTAKVAKASSESKTSKASNDGGTKSVSCSILYTLRLISFLLSIYFISHIHFNLKINSQSQVAAISV